MKPAQIILGILAIAIVVGAFSIFQFMGEQNPEIRLSEVTTPTNSETSNNGNKPTDAKNVTIKFGFDLRASPEEDARQYLPFLNYLKRETGYDFELRFTGEDGKITDDLGKGIVQLAAVGAVSFIEAQSRYKARAMARGLNKQGKAAYQSVIVVAKDSNLKSIKDLSGKRFAFGSMTSTQGHVIPRIQLNEAGIPLEKLSSYKYTGSHQNCANAVISGAADACGMQDTLGRTLQEQGRVKIIHTSPDYPSSGIAATGSMKPDVFLAIQSALVRFDPLGKNSTGLYNWDRTEMPNGFIASQDADYSEFASQMSVLGPLEK